MLINWNIPQWQVNRIDKSHPSTAKSCLIVVNSLISDFFLKNKVSLQFSFEHGINDHQIDLELTFTMMIIEILKMTITARCSNTFFLHIRVAISCQGISPNIYIRVTIAFLSSFHIAWNGKPMYMLGLIP